MKRIVILILAILFLGGISMAVYRFPAEHIESVVLVEGKIEIVKSQVNAVQNQYLLLTSIPQNPGLSKHIWKEIYIAKDSKIVLEKIIEGKFIPAQDERWEFTE